MKDQLGEYLEQIIGRSPMIVPSFVYINRDAMDLETSNQDDDSIIGMTLEEQG
jgi:hypothetical protein